MRLYAVQNKQIFSKLVLDGLKLSENPSWAEKAPWDDDSSVMRCVANFPGNYDKTNDSVIRLEVPADDVFVLEGAFEGASDEDGKDLFKNSAVFARDYKFGSFIKPVYFVTCDVSVENIFPQDTAEGDIKIFESDERFYIDCVSASLEEKYGEYRLFSVRSLFESLAASGRMTKIENGEYIIFKDRDGKLYPVCRHFHD